MKIPPTEESASTYPQELLYSAEDSRTEPLADAMDRRTRYPGPFLAATLLAAVLTVGGTEPPFLMSRKRDEIAAESSTELFEVNPILLRQVRELFEQGASEFFQDGMHSIFSQRLIEMLARYGRVALRAVAEYMFSGRAKPQVASEAVRWLADFKDPATFHERWVVLQRTLRDKSAQVRDETILGFATIDDPRAAKVLREARDSEQVQQLRLLIDQVIAQLQRSR